MPRPRRCRRVHAEPGFDYFKPRGVRLSDLEESILTVSEYEAIRLKDLEKLSQEECAKKMDISQPTLHRLLISGRKKIADAIVNGKAIKIFGGEYKMPSGDGKGNMGIGVRGRFGGDRGRMNVMSKAICICPKCSYEVQHNRGEPCTQRECPKCNTKMNRK